MFESEIETLSELLTSFGFLMGFAAGLMILVTFAVSSSARTSRLFGYATWITLVLVVAMYLDFGRRLGSSVGLLVIAASAWRLDSTSPSPSGTRALPSIGLVGGAILFAWRSGLDGPVWAIAAIPVFTLTLGASLARLREARLGSVIGPMLGIAAIGVWATVPDTEMAMVLMGSTLPIFAITPQPIAARITATGAFALAAIISWIVVQGGAEREASMIGAWGCFTAVVILAAILRPASKVLGGATTLIGVHLGAVVISSRLIGLGGPVWPSLGWLAVLAVVVTVVLRWAINEGTRLVSKQDLTQ